MDLRFDDDALEAIAQEALDRKVGARGLRSVMEGAMTDIMFEIPSDLTITSVEITRETIVDHQQPLVLRDSEHPRVPVHKVGRPDALAAGAE